ncbi:MAG: bacillithiol biosynthesis protein BshC, partial [Longimicrobiales bacterium]
MVRDYVSGAGSASRFFRGKPGDVGGFRAKAKELDGAFTPERRALLRDLIRPVGPSGGAMLDKAIQPGGYFVTTGQQPGLFGGPLYSLYKALTAVRLAEELSGLLSAPVMPLFWIASDDHDWEEANHTYLIDGGNQLRKLSLGPHPDPVRRSLCLTPLGAAVDPLIDALEGILPPSDSSAGYVAAVREHYRPEASASDAFVGLLRVLLSGTAIGFVDSAAPALKSASVPLLARELERAEAGEQTLSATTAALESEGYKPQVVLR